MTEDFRKAIRLAKFDGNDLSRYAERLGAGKGAVEKDFLISTFFLLLAYDKQFAPFAKKLVFRGGTCIKKVYYPTDARFSEDLDFTSLSVNEMNSFLVALEGLARQDLGVTSVTEAVKTYENSKGLDIRLNYTSVLGQPNHIVFKLSTSKTLRNAKRRGVEVMPYFELFQPTITAMDIREILTEKLRALLQRARPRDVFDVWFLTREKRMRIDLKMLNEKLKRSCEAAPPEKKHSAMFYSYASVTGRMKEITDMAWKQELGGRLIKRFPSREAIVFEVSKILKRVGDIRLDVEK